MADMRTPRWRLAELLRLPRRAAPMEVPSHPQVPDPADPANPAIIYLADLLRDTREELNRADSKAGLLLAATGVVVSALLAGLLSGRWSPFDLDSRVGWVWWVGVGFAALGIFSIAWAVYPWIHRRGIPRPGTPSYYGDVAEYRSIEDFRRAIEQRHSHLERLIDQTYVTSRVIHHKYRLLRRGLRFLLVAIVACVLAVLINILLTA